MPIVLLYHDVIAAGQDEASGFPGPGAARYKLTADDFRAHLNALAHALPDAPILLTDELTPESEAAWQLTFDDGGVSALAPTADLLEERGWRGHFFITTDFIDKPTFLSRGQIRELQGRGHVIGTHSCSHPERISYCSWEQMLHEWTASRAVLEDILGSAVTSASVPGGFYSRTLAHAAAQAGIKLLFNSEPTARSRYIDGCVVQGRYTIYRDMAPESAVVLAQGKILPRMRQTVAWNMKKLAKATGGSLYSRFRQWLLKRAQAKRD